MEILIDTGLVVNTYGKCFSCGANLFTRLNYWIVACGGQPSVAPPELVGVENPSGATIVCQGETFTFKLDQALADNGGIKLVEETAADAIDIPYHSSG